MIAAPYILVALLLPATALTYARTRGTSADAASFERFAHVLQAEGPQVPSGGTLYVSGAPAFGAFANEGKLVPPTLLRRVTASSGQILYQSEQTAQTVVTPATAYLITSMLEDVVKESFGKNAGLFNNAGQHYNHMHFWKWMKPNGGGDKIPGALKAVWPGLSRPQQEAIEGEFANARSISVELASPRIAVNAVMSTGASRSKVPRTIISSVKPSPSCRMRWM